MIFSYLLYSNFESYTLKRFHQRLSDHLVVYARDVDAMDTLIIRDLRENTNFTCFGIKCFEMISRFYVLLWDILARVNDVSLKYIETRDDDCARNEQTVIITKYGTEIVYTLDDLIQIEYYKEQNQFTMFNLKRRRIIDCGVLLELRDVIELVDYMCKRFHFHNFLNYETNMYMYDEFF